MDCESALCLCAYHRYWQGGTLAGCRAQATAPTDWLSGKNRRSSKGEKIAPLILFPPLRSPSGWHPDSVRVTAKGGKEWAGRSERLQAGNKKSLLPASRCLQVNVPPFLSLSMVVCRNLLSTFNIYFYSNAALRGAMIMIWSGEKKGGRNSWDKVECMTMCLLSTEPAGHGNLDPVSTWSNRAREAWAGHRSWCQLSQRVLAESAVWKQTSLPVQLGTEPPYRVESYG